MDSTPPARPAPPSRPWSALLAVRPLPTIPPQARSGCPWPPVPVRHIALRSMARAVASGGSEALFDGELACEVAPITMITQACRISPKVFWRRVHRVRACTGWPFATLFCERLASLLRTQPIGLIVLLNPLTHFFDEDVTDRKAVFLRQHVLRQVRQLPPAWPKLLIAQTVPSPHTPRRLFDGELLRAAEVGLRLHACEGPWRITVVKPKLPLGTPGPTA
jgi:hypothetical protein